MDYPKGLFPNIEKFPDHRKTGCPAVKSTDKRIYRVKAPFNVDIRVYMDNGRVMIEWEYDVNQLKVSDPMNNLMSEMFVGSKEKMALFKFNIKLLIYLQQMIQILK